MARCIGIISVWMPRSHFKGLDTDTPLFRTSRPPAQLLGRQSTPARPHEILAEKCHTHLGSNQTVSELPFYRVKQKNVGNNETINRCLSRVE